MMSRFKNVHPLMIYMPSPDIKTLKAFAKTNDLSVSSVARQGVAMRMGSGDRYNQGWNDAIKECMATTQNVKGAQMKFPSGASFADLVNIDLKNLIRPEVTP